MLHRKGCKVKAAEEFWDTEKKEVNEFDILNTLLLCDERHAPMSQPVGSEDQRPGDFRSWFSIRHFQKKLRVIPVLATAEQLFGKGDGFVQLVVCPQVGMKLVPEIEPKQTVTCWFNSFLIRKNFWSHEAPGFMKTHPYLHRMFAWVTLTLCYPSFLIFLSPSTFQLALPIFHVVPPPPKFVYEKKMCLICLCKAASVRWGLCWFFWSPEHLGVLGSSKCSARPSASRDDLTSLTSS